MRQANRFRTFSRFAARISWSQIAPTWVRVEIGAIWDRILCRQLSRIFRFFCFRPHLAIEMALHLLQSETFLFLSFSSLFSCFIMSLFFKFPFITFLLFLVLGS